jgi:hypothetical protein
MAEIAAKIILRLDQNAVLLVIATIKNAVITKIAVILRLLIRHAAQATQTTILVVVPLAMHITQLVAPRTHLTIKNAVMPEIAAKIILRLAQNAVLLVIATIKNAVITQLVALRTRLMIKNVAMIQIPIVAQILMVYVV